jgi:hypothetical protein
MGAVAPFYFADIRAGEQRTMERAYTSSSPGHVLFCEVAARRDPGIQRCATIDPVAAVGGMPLLPSWSLDHITVEEEGGEGGGATSYFYHAPRIQPGSAAGYSVVLIPSERFERAQYSDAGEPDVDEVVGERDRPTLMTMRRRVRGNDCTLPDIHEEPSSPSPSPSPPPSPATVVPAAPAGAAATPPPRTRSKVHRAHASDTSDESDNETDGALAEAGAAWLW